MKIAETCVCCDSPRLNASSAILMPFIAERVFKWKPYRPIALKTIPSGISHAICNSLHCQRCGLLFLDMRFSEDEMKRLYEGYRGKEYTALREQYEPGYEKRNEELLNGISYLKKVENFIRPYLPLRFSILDWGGDTGKNTPFQDSSDSIHIYDINQSSGFASKKGLKNYDLIVCSNVLEHEPYPQNLLAEIKEFMSKDTLLYLEMPFERIMRDNTPLLKEHWHEHINFYSENSLALLLKSCALDVKEFHTLHDKNASYFQILCKKRNL